MRANHDTRVTHFARTNSRPPGVRFGIRRADRRLHFYCCGKTGTGKSHLLGLMIEQDMRNAEGFALLDPHGDLVTGVVDRVPPERRGDVVYFDATDPSLAWRFNPFADVPVDKRALAAAGLVETFKKLWPDDWGPRLEHLLRNVVFTLLEMPGATLADIPPLLADRDYRAPIVREISNDAVRDFWLNEYARYSPAFRAVVIAPLQNKIGAMLTDPLLRRIFCEPGPAIELRTIMDRGQILLLNLDKGRIGEGPSGMLGSLILSSIALAGLSRSNVPIDTRRDFFVYADEFQAFTTLALASMLSELRKFRVALVLAHQHLSQLEPDIRDAVFGNVGTIVSFRVGAADAAYLAREFAPTFAAEDIIALPRYEIYVRLMIDGEASRPFSAACLDALPT